MTVASGRVVATVIRRSARGTTTHDGDPLSGTDDREGKPGLVERATDRVELLRVWTSWRGGSTTGITPTSSGTHWTGCSIIVRFVMRI